MQIVSTICMKRQILYTGENRKKKKNIINLSSAELAQRVVEVKHKPKDNRTNRQALKKMSTMLASEQDNLTVYINNKQTNSKQSRQSYSGRLISSSTAKLSKFIFF